MRTPGDAGADHARSHVTGALNVPLVQPRHRLGELDAHLAAVTYCNEGVSGNAAQNILLCCGFTTVANLSGSNTNHQAHLQTAQPVPTP